MSKNFISVVPSHPSSLNLISWLSRIDLLHFKIEEVKGVNNYFLLNFLKCLEFTTVVSEGIMKILNYMENTLMI